MKERIMNMQNTRALTGKFLAKNNKFSNDIKPPPLCNKSKYDEKIKADKLILYRRNKQNDQQRRPEMMQD